jgi:hypothetical protein
MKYKSPLTYHSKDMANVGVFLKVGQTSKSRVQGQKLMVPLESSCHKEYTYEIPIT